MRILNPQSATLPNAEVLHFLHTHPPRAADVEVGSYVITNLHNHTTIRRDLDTYFREITPWTSSYTSAFQAQKYLALKNTQTVAGTYSEGFLKVLLVRLKEWELTKGEVVMILNLGLGLGNEDGRRLPPRLRKDVLIAAAAGDGDGDKTSEEQEGSDELLLGVVCEELEQRFNEKDIRGILGAVGEVLKEFQTLPPPPVPVQKSRRNRKVGAAGKGSPVVDKAKAMMSDTKMKQAYDGAEELEGEGSEDEDLVGGEGREEAVAEEL